MKKIILLTLALTVGASAARLINCKWEGRTTKSGRYVSGYWGLYETRDGYLEYFSGNRYCPYNL